MIPLLELHDGRQVWLDGDQITQQDALDIARGLVKTWGALHPAATAKLMVEVKPKIWSACPHYDTLEEGLKWEGYS